MRKRHANFIGEPCPHYPHRYKTEASHEAHIQARRRYDAKQRALRPPRVFEAHAYDLTLRLQRILANINYRCRHRERYAGRGIRNYLTFDDLETLWKRDNAAAMSRPSIDRRNNDGDYTFYNCRFIELFDNISLGTKVRESLRHRPQVFRVQPELNFNSATHAPTSTSEEATR